jgi:hypothetical protein
MRAFYCDFIAKELAGISDIYMTVCGGKTVKVNINKRGKINVN